MFMTNFQGDRRVSERKEVVVPRFRIRVNLALALLISVSAHLSQFVIMTGIFLVPIAVDEPEVLEHLAIPTPLSTTVGVNVFRCWRLVTSQAHQMESNMMMTVSFTGKLHTFEL